MNSTRHSPNSRNDESTSHSLLELVRSHDEEAWRCLTELYGPLIYYWSRNAGLGAEDAADVLQDVFRSVVIHIARFEESDASGSFRAWLWTITRNKIRDFFKVRSGKASAAGGTNAYLLMLEFLSLIFSQVDGRGLVHLQKLPKLWGLHLPYTPTNDVGLQDIAGLSELTWLNLGFTNVSDKCLSQVSKLKKLDTLELNDADVTGAGLSLLSDIASLRTLDLQGTEITDADIEHLGGMTQLTTLRVGSRLSPNTVATLRGRLPNCTIDTTP